MTRAFIARLYLSLFAAALSCEEAWAQDTAKPTVGEITRQMQDPVSGLRTVFLQDVILPFGNANSFTIQPIWPFRITDGRRLRQDLPGRRTLLQLGHAGFPETQRIRKSSAAGR